MRIKLTISYDGSGFCGFQRQADAVTVQSVLEDALRSLYKSDITICGSGRTDAGVHAVGQVAHYDTDKNIDIKKIAGAVNSYLPPSVRVNTAETVSGEFDARRSAKSKTYIYDMYFSKIDNPLLINRAARFTDNPDLEIMKKAAEMFVGTHDFNAFHCIGSSAKTTVRTVSECVIQTLEIYGAQIVRLKISANGFLYKMVRLITNAVIKAGAGKLSLEDIKLMLSVPGGTYIKEPANACGLCLLKVEY